MRQVIKQRDIRLLNKIRRTDSVIPFIEKNSPKVAQFDNFYYLCTHETQDKDIRRLF